MLIQPEIALAYQAEIEKKRTIENQTNTTGTDTAQLGIESINVTGKTDNASGSTPIVSGGGQVISPPKTSIKRRYYGKVTLNPATAKLDFSKIYDGY
ncbi:hypothetical protein [Ammoniphilus sp. 3BR4]|uniref:hypothetical protein n=1 Tax=Ammoniphilus sp. 3BR4 TaxID=3158265 RepID=UPI00346688A7